MMQIRKSPPFWSLFWAPLVLILRLLNSFFSRPRKKKILMNFCGEQKTHVLRSWHISLAHFDYWIFFPKVKGRSNKVDFSSELLRWAFELFLGRALLKLKRDSRVRRAQGVSSSNKALTTCEWCLACQVFRHPVNLFRDDDVFNFTRFAKQFLACDMEHNQGC